MHRTLRRFVGMLNGLIGSFEFFLRIWLVLLNAAGAAGALAAGYLGFSGAWMAATFLEGAIGVEFWDMKAAASFLAGTFCFLSFFWWFATAGDRVLRPK